MTQLMNETRRTYEVQNQEFIRVTLTWKCQMA